MTALFYELRCLACGDRDFLEREIAGETVSVEGLARAGISVKEGQEVLICWECLWEFCL